MILIIFVRIRSIPTFYAYRGHRGPPHVSTMSPATTSLRSPSCVHNAHVCLESARHAEAEAATPSSSSNSATARRVEDLHGAAALRPPPPPRSPSPPMTPELPGPRAVRGSPVPLNGRATIAETIGYVHASRRWKQCKSPVHPYIYPHYSALCNEVNSRSLFILF